MQNRVQHLLNATLDSAFINFQAFLEHFLLILFVQAQR